MLCVGVNIASAWRGIDGRQQSENGACILNAIKNLTFRNKLIASYLFITVMTVVVSVISNWVAFRNLKQDSLPTLQAVALVGRLARQTQAETLEYVLSGEDEALAQIATSRGELLDAALVVEGLADDADEAAPFAELTGVVQEMVGLSEAIVQSHSATLAAAERLRGNSEQAVAVFAEANGVLNWEIAQNLADGDLDELEHDSIPSTLLLHEFVMGTRLLQTEALNFVANGDAEAIRLFAEAEVRLEQAQEGLTAVLEPDEPGEAGLVERIDVVEEGIETAGQQIIDAHSQTLALLAELEELEQELNGSLATADQLAARDVDEGFNITTISLVVGSLLIFVVSFFVSLLLDNVIAKPILQLEKMAVQMRDGNYDVQVQLEARDEISTLGQTLNQMAAQLRQTLHDLHQRSLAIETSAAVGRALSTVLDENELVKAVVEQVQAAFSYYHVHIYLLNDSGKTLLMAAGTGEAGEKMLVHGHRVPMGRGMVGRAAATNTSGFAPDTSWDDAWLPNPLLPDTQAEIAVPIALGDEVLGVLDVQQNVVQGLTFDDVQMLEAIANQTAVTLRNARLYAQTQQQVQREAYLNEMNQKLDAAQTVEEVMQIAVRELGQALRAEKTAIRLVANGRHKTITQS